MENRWFSRPLLTLPQSEVYLYFICSFQTFAIPINVTGLSEGAIEYRLARRWMSFRFHPHGRTRRIGAPRSSRCHPLPVDRSLLRNTSSLEGPWVHLLF